jgi:hypothetical protein
VVALQLCTIVGYESETRFSSKAQLELRHRSWSALGRVSSRSDFRLLDESSQDDDYFREA